MEADDLLLGLQERAVLTVFIQNINNTSVVRFWTLDILASCLIIYSIQSFAADPSDEEEAKSCDAYQL